MDIANLFMEDTDFNICLSWLCGSTNGGTFNIGDHFGSKLKCPPSMKARRDEWYVTSCDFLVSQIWDDAIGGKHDYKVDDPEAHKRAKRMVRELNALVERFNKDPDYPNWDRKNKRK